MIVRAATQAMGTRFELTLDGGDPHHLRACAEGAIARIEELDRRYSRFRPDSLLSHVNASGAERPVGVDRDLFELLAACRRVWEASEGAFDPTVGPLMRAWGFHGGAEEAGVEEAVAQAAACVGMHLVALDTAQSAVSFGRRGVSLDLGGIAKGQALDEAAAILRDCGVERALLHGGTSSVVAIGAPPGKSGWMVAIRGTPFRVALADRALSVSAPSGRQVEVGGRVLGHVLDPRTGAPTEGVSLACVVGTSARDADAWSTALLVLGRRAQGMDGELTSLLPDEDAGWRIDGPDEGLFWAAEPISVEQE